MARRNHIKPAVSADVDVDQDVAEVSLRYAKSSAANQQALAQLAEQLGVSPEEVAELSRVGFTVPDHDTHHRMIISSSARDKYGKTDWALRTTPEPIALIDMDLGTEGLMNRAPFKDRRIIRKAFTLRKQAIMEGEQLTKSEVESEWHQVGETLRAVMKSPLIRTVVVDTGTEAWELARLAHFGKLSNVMSHHYGPVNKEFRDIVQLAYGRPDLNAVFIHKQKKEYKNDKWDGSFAFSGMSDMPFLVQINIEHTYDRDTGMFGIRVINCRQNADLNDEELEGPMGTFARLGRLVFPESTKEDWK